MTDNELNTLDAQLTADPEELRTGDVRALHETLATLRADGLAMAKDELAQRPFRIQALTAASSSRSTRRWALGLATAALAVGVSVPLVLHTSTHPAQNNTPNIAVNHPAAVTTTASDETLMADVQSDLDAGLPDSLSPLDSSTSSSTR